MFLDFSTIDHWLSIPGNRIFFSAKSSTVKKYKFCYCNIHLKSSWSVLEKVKRMALWCALATCCCSSSYNVYRLPSELPNLYVKNDVSKHQHVRGSKLACKTIHFTNARWCPLVTCWSILPHPTTVPLITINATMNVLN